MKKEKPQIFMIHGGMTFKNRKDYINYLKNRNVSTEEKKGWHGNYIKKKVGKKFDIIKPRMPLQDNAKYEEWKMVFESYFPLLRKNIILIGSSLGGIFLAKYLSENKFPKKILSTYLICPPFDDTIPNEDLVGGFKLNQDLSMIKKNSKHLTLMFSADDDVVPVSHAEKFRNKIKDANIIIYESKNGHFKISKFPEIIKMIKKDYKRI